MENKNNQARTYKKREVLGIRRCSELDIYIYLEHATKKMKLNIVFQSSTKICNAFRFKDQIPIYMNSNVIYKYNCNTCNDVYNSETKRHIAMNIAYEIQKQYCHEYSKRNIATIKQRIN